MEILFKKKKNICRECSTKFPQILCSKKMLEPYEYIAYVCGSYLLTVCSIPYPGVALGLSDFTLFYMLHGMQKY